MKVTLSRRIKLILSILLVLIGIILLFNTNNNPKPFIERILKPIHIGEGTLYYSGIFPIAFIYYGLKGVNQFGNYRWLRTRQNRIIVVIIMLMCTRSLNTSVVKLAKSMCKDLNAIYYERKYLDTQIDFKEYNDRQEILNSKFTLENCSGENQEFFIKIQVPELLKDSVVQKELTAKSEDLKDDKKFVLHGKERLEMNAVFIADLEGEGSNFNGGSTELEFKLVNDKEEIIFTKGWLD